MAISTKLTKHGRRYQASVYYRDEFDQPHRKTSKWYRTKSEAKKAERELQAIKIDPEDKLTFEKLCLEYIESTKCRNTPKTTRDKLHILYDYLEPMLQMRPSKITTQTIRAIFKQSDIQKLGVSRKNRIRGLMKAALDYGMWFYELERNPVDAFPTFKNDKVKKPRVVYTPQEVVKIMNAIDIEHLEHRNALVFLYFTGTRLNECLSLTFNDIIENGTKVNVWRQWVNGDWVLLKSKNSTRTIDLPLPAQKVYHEQLEKYRVYADFNGDWFIFGGERQLPSNTLREVYKRAQKKACLPESRLHDLRHGHASILLENVETEADVLKVSQRLGHSSVSTTLEIYAHILDASEEKLINVLNNLQFA